MKTLSLNDARADGWFAQLGDGSDGFNQLCELVGDRLVAFSVIAGVRITALSYDQADPERSVVEIEVGERSRQRLPLAELRRRLSDAIASQDEPTPPLPEDPSPDAIQAHVGFRYVLLAPLFGLSLLSLEVEGEESSIRFEDATEEHLLPLPAFRRMLRELVREEGASSGTGEGPFSIDLNLIAKAQAAADDGNHEEVAELLGNWPGPLSMLLRTADGQRLAPEVKAALAGALGALGSAYVALGRVEWAQEVLRLGIQWAQEQPSATAALFARLGRAQLAEERAGEAIGTLRRALGLGAPKRDVLPPLAQAFEVRGRWLAALLLAEDARAEGIDDEHLDAIRTRAREALGPAWERFRARVPSSSATR